MWHRRIRSLTITITAIPVPQRSTPQISTVLSLVFGCKQLLSLYCQAYYLILPGWCNMRRRRMETISNRIDHRQVPSSLGTAAESEPTEYLDEDEQTEIIANFEIELAEQVAAMNGAFSTVCYVSMAISFLILALERTWVMQVYVLYGCVTFWLARNQVSVKMGRKGMGLTSILLLVSIPLQPLLYDYYQTREFAHVDLHWALAGMTAMLMLGSYFLRIDSLSHKRNIEGLASSTYKHRSL